MMAGIFLCNKASDLLRWLLFLCTLMMKRRRSSSSIEDIQLHLSCSHDVCQHGRQSIMSCTILEVRNRHTGRVRGRMKLAVRGSGASREGRHSGSSSRGRC
jgi:hypothetical protein